EPRSVEAWSSTATWHSGPHPESGGKHTARSRPPSCRAGPEGYRTTRRPEARIPVRPPAQPSPRPRRPARHPPPCHAWRRRAGARGGADVLGPSPPGLESCWANSEPANVYDFELSLLHYACLVGGLEPPKDHLDLRSSHESPRLIHTMSVEL